MAYAIKKTIQRPRQTKLNVFQLTLNVSKILQFNIPQCNNILINKKMARNQTKK